MHRKPERQRKQQRKRQPGARTEKAACVLARKGTQPAPEAQRLKIAKQGGLSAIQQIVAHVSADALRLDAAAQSQRACANGQLRLFAQPAEQRNSATIICAAFHIHIGIGLIR